MQATISKWGNSLALRLPRHVTEQIQLVEGSSVELDVSGGALTVTPSRPKFKLSELLEGEPKRGPAKVPTEVDWGPAKCDEAW